MANGPSLKLSPCVDKLRFRVSTAWSQTMSRRSAGAGQAARRRDRHASPIVRSRGNRGRDRPRAGARPRRLRTLWRVTFGSSPPPAFSKDLMTRFICWHIQELPSPCLIQRSQSIRMASHGATSREPITLGASSRAPCSCPIPGRGAGIFGALPEIPTQRDFVGCLLIFLLRYRPSCLVISLNSPRYSHGSATLTC
jgi:hypothetical protein